MHVHTFYPSFNRYNPAASHMDRFKNFSVDQLQKELKPAALKSRAKELNDRYTSPSSTSSYRKPAAPAPPIRSNPQTSPSLHAPPAPPVRSTAPAPPPRRSPQNAHVDAVNAASQDTFEQDSQQIHWRNLRQADKDALFKAFDAVSGPYQLDHGTRAEKSVRSLLVEGTMKGHPGSRQPIPITLLGEGKSRSCPPTHRKLRGLSTASTSILLQAEVRVMRRISHTISRRPLPGTQHGLRASLQLHHHH